MATAGFGGPGRIAKSGPVQAWWMRLAGNGRRMGRGSMLVRRDACATPTYASANILQHRFSHWCTDYSYLPCLPLHPAHSSTFHHAKRSSMFFTNASIPTQPFIPEKHPLTLKHSFRAKSWTCTSRASAALRTASSPPRTTPRCKSPSPKSTTRAR